MATLPRSQIISPGDKVRLRALFKGSDGQPADLDAYPEVTIIAPSGGVVSGPTSAGVFRSGVGEYGFDFAVGLAPAIGIWNDVWDGTLNGFTVSGEFSFVVHITQMPAINTDGYVHLNDDPGFDYSQIAINNINHLLKSLKARLRSSGKHRSVDAFGNVEYRDCDVFSVDDLVSYLARSLSEFNAIPHFTMFTFDDTEIIQQFHGVLVQGATIYALAGQALLERGREFQISDNGIGFTPPTLSEILNTQFQTELNNWYEKIKIIKATMKPSPIGLGIARPFNVSTTLRAMRHFRQRQIF